MDLCARHYQQYILCDLWLLCLLCLLSLAACSAYADPGALNRAEWVKFVAVFFNKEVEANKLFSTISTDYQKLNASARAAGNTAAAGCYIHASTAHACVQLKSCHPATNASMVNMFIISMLPCSLTYLCTNVLVL
jgi:hypothetical protein